MSQYAKQRSHLTAVATEANGGCTGVYASCDIAEVWHTRDQPEAMQEAGMCGHGRAGRAPDCVNDGVAEQIPN